MADLEINGYGYEWDAKHLGGPFDGLDSSVISFESLPPLTTFYTLPDEEKEFLEGEKSLGKKLLDKWKEKHIPDHAKVAIYQIEGNPKEYEDEDVINYHFREVMQYGQYKQKYLNKEPGML